ncbi:amidohydrolase family protein [Methyloterricola oryzae]|uniref:amidohydrolase family protein n=1 Tax=Methyloterricola oryzae TaxID=1495050 RepID=UPI00069B5640|nr:hypothetical protein [Methyloterricola oryzae]
MTRNTNPPRLARALLGCLLLSGGCGNLLAHEGEDHASDNQKTEKPAPCQVLAADRLFDGVSLQTEMTVLLKKDKVVKVGTFKELKKSCKKRIDLGDATLMPGFIELHGHVAYQNVPRDVILRHGVTTARDVGGPLLAPTGGDGRLRLLTAGPIITGKGGYPSPVFTGDVSAEIATADEAKTLVQSLVAGGANIIKLGLEPGGEVGAPWTTGHTPSTEPPWPMPSQEVVQAVVDEAHRLGKKVTAHAGEAQGLALAIDAGVDELAHVPCDFIPTTPRDLLQEAVDKDIRFLSTVDTFSHCQGTHENLHRLVHLGAKLHYAAEIAHTEIPWGIDAQELHSLLHVYMTVNPSADVGELVLKLFQSATSEAGKVLELGPEGGLDKLGTLTPGAPADVIAVRGNAFTQFKPMEYPDLVISGGRVIHNLF